MFSINTGLTQLLDDGSQTYLYGPSTSSGQAGRVAQVNTTTNYFLADALGSVRQMTNASGNIVLAKSYDPYGVTTASTGADSTSYGFTGEQAVN